MQSQADVFIGGPRAVADFKMKMASKPKNEKTIQYGWTSTHFVKKSRTLLQHLPSQKRAKIMVGFAAETQTYRIREEQAWT